MTRHIALVGKMGSGKTTIAKELVEKHGFYRIALADEVKNDTIGIVNSWLEWYGLDDKQISRADLEANKAFWRPLLQFVGTELGRQLTENDRFWIDQFLHQVAWCTSNVVCDDVRYLNEAEALKASGFLIVKVFRPEPDRLAAVGGTGIEGHTSETELERITPDLWVHNDWPDAPKHVAASLAKLVRE